MDSIIENEFQFQFLEKILKHLEFSLTARSLAIIAALIILAGCTQSSPTGQAPKTPKDLSAGKLNVVATTTIVDDIVRNIAGDHINLQILVPAGVDEHSFQYTPEDVMKVADTQVVFMNGAGLETFMEPLLKNVGEQVRVVSVSDGITLLKGNPDPHQDQQETAAGDPHVWTDPENIKIWTQNIAAALAELDPQHSAEYQANAQKYRASLDDLNNWILEQTAMIPVKDRLLVSDHQVFTYFAKRYGFEMVGALIPSYSTLAEPTAQELAALEDAIRQVGVKAIFVGNNLNPNLAERVAADTQVKLVQVYTGSLTAGPPAGSYLDYMRFNVSSMITALK